jgi:hypothetical protein
MSTVYSNLYDGFATNATTDGSWDDAQGDADTDGNLWRNNNGTYAYGVFCKNAGDRSGDDYKCYRSYFIFPLSSESGTVESATISIYMDNLGTSSGNSARAILVEATALDDGVEDHGNVFSSGVTWHDDISNVVVISTTKGYHDFTMNSDGITLIQNAIGSGSVTVGLVGWYNDYSENIPIGGGAYTKFKVWYSNYVATSFDPKVDITYTIAAVTDNATFFGANF